MTKEAKTALNALLVTAYATIYLFGVLWLCLYLSWWFAVLWFIPACWLVILVAMTYRELKKQRKSNEKPLTKSTFNHE